MSEEFFYICIYWILAMGLYQHWWKAKLTFSNTRRQRSIFFNVSSIVGDGSISTSSKSSLQELTKIGPNTYRWAAYIYIFMLTSLWHLTSWDLHKVVKCRVYGIFGKYVLHDMTLLYDLQTFYMHCQSQIARAHSNNIINIFSIILFSMFHNYILLSDSNNLLCQIPLIHSHPKP